MTEAQLTRLQRVMQQHKCDEDTAQRYIDLRDEGYSIFVAKVMSGLADPEPDHDD